MKPEKWKPLHRKEVFSHPRMRLVEDTVKLPDGKEVEYLRLAPSETNSVAIIALNDSRELLLQREYSYPPNEVLWQLPGGKALKDETIEESVNRELAEESGLNAKILKQVGFVYTNNRRSDEKQHIVLCKELYEKEATRDPEEFIENHWVPLSEVRRMMASGELQNINALAALGIYFSKLAEGEFNG